jgi:hypothetical protein
LTTTPARKRHRWVKLRLHVYVCRVCGCGRVNAEDRFGGWFTTFHLPDGTSRVDVHVPGCEVGERTAAVLKKHESAIACAPATFKHAGSTDADLSRS